MAATDPTPPGALLAAALALPGVALPLAAHAQSVPDAAFVQFKYVDYRDWQPGARRMRVDNPGFYALKPLSDSLFVEGSIVYDGMSGASPLFFDALSGASGEGVRDYRTAGDLKVTKVFDRFAVAVGGAYSHERDYISRAGTIEVRAWTEDRNRTFAFAVSGAADRIHTESGAADHERKHVLDVLVGITQVVNPTLIVQSNLTYSRGHGYFTDPYKLLDNRPDHRRVVAWLTRANQHFPDLDGTLKVGYRYLDDSFGADSHMLEAAWHQPLPHGWSVTPGLRYFTQKAASFFYGPPIGRGFRPGEPYTADARLSAYGALTPGLLVARQFADGWVADLKVEFYRQKASWRAGGDGSPGILPLSARWIEVGVGRSF
ncbi:MAG TPA: DUF3570 domain-containing protein [Casimicrobiaceae bacterium]|nr:DUF3570 domain-containing protein [Casimicrobiaceae bacterium]